MSRDRYQIWRSTEVVKWSSGHVKSKFSWKDPFESAASDEEEEEANTRSSAMERRIGCVDTTLLSILAVKTFGDSQLDPCEVDVH